jgi:hypothetical protein
VKFRWRPLSRSEEVSEANRHTVFVRVSEHRLVPCVLEWQAAEQTRKDFWTPVLVEFPSTVGEKP